jgi:hypothetical protein
MTSIQPFTLTVEGREFEKSWDILFAPEIGVGGELGVRLGPLGARAASGTITAKGGLGLNITLEKNSTAKDQIRIERRAEFGLGGELSVGKLTTVGELRIGAEVDLYRMVRGTQAYLFENPYSERERMAQAALLLETLQVGGAAVSPHWGLVTSAIINVLTRGSDADEILAQAHASSGEQAGLEGHFGIGFKTQLIAPLSNLLGHQLGPVAKVIDLKLPSFDADGAVYFGAEHFSSSEEIGPIQSYMLKTYIQLIAEADLTLLKLNLLNGLRPGNNFDADFDIGIGGELLNGVMVFEQAGYYNESGLFQGITLSLETGDYRLGGPKHKLVKNIWIVPERVLKKFIRDVQTNATYLASDRINVYDGAKYLIVGPVALAADFAMILSQAINHAAANDLIFATEKEESAVAISEIDFSLDFGVSFIAGGFIHLGANIEYLEAENFKADEAHFVSKAGKFLVESAYQKDAYIQDVTKLHELIENMLKGIWPLIESAVANLVDLVGDIVDAGKDWIIGWWDGSGKRSGFNPQDMSAVRLIGGGDELPDQAEIRMARFSPHLDYAAAAKMVYKSNRLTRKSLHQAAQVENGLVIGIGDCYQIFARDQNRNEITAFLQPCELVIRPNVKEILAAGLIADKKESLRIYRYSRETNSWAAVSGFLGNAEILSTNVSEPDVYMLGIEFEPDSLAPSFGALAPTPGSHIKTLTEISAVVIEEGSGIDILRTVVLLDSTAIPSQFNPQESKIYIGPAVLPADLKAGKHKIFMRVYDRAGNFNEIEYEFTVGEVTAAQTYFYPNPFNPLKGELGTIAYTLSKPAEVTIRIYDGSNALVKTIVQDQNRDAGVDLTENWDGRNELGQMVANGVYFCVIETSAGEKTVGKIAIVKY